MISIDVPGSALSELSLGAMYMQATAMELDATIIKAALEKSNSRNELMEQVVPLYERKLPSEYTVDSPPVVRILPIMCPSIAPPPSMNCW